jgi:hypothetical protein
MMKTKPSAPRAHAIQVVKRVFGPGANRNGQYDGLISVLTEEFEEYECRLDQQDSQSLMNCDIDSGELPDIEWETGES